MSLPKKEETVEDVFPEIPCGHIPFGMFVIVQIKLSKRVTSGGIIIIDDTKQTEQDNTQVAKVVAIGPAAFKDRRTFEPWPEGAWYKVGDYVRCPKYGGDRWRVDYEYQEEERKVGNLVLAPSVVQGKVEFAMFKDMDIRSSVEDPLKIKAYI